MSLHAFSPSLRRLLLAGAAFVAGTLQAQVTVTVNPSAVALTTATARTFTATVTGAGNTGVTWLVRESGGGTISTKTGAYTAPATPGVYHVRATSKANSSAYGESTVTVVAPPNATISAAPSATAGSTGLSASVASVAGSTYAWTLSGGTILSGATASTLIYAAGNGNSLTLGCTVRNAAGAQASSSKGQSLIPAPAITSFTTSRTLVTAGSSLTLLPVFANGTGALSPGGSVASGSAVVVTPAASTTYILTVTNAVGSAVNAQVAVTVVAAPAIASLTAAKATVTLGTGTTLTPVFSGGTGTLTGFGTVTSGLPVATGPLAASTTFTLTVTNAAGDSVTRPVTVAAVAAPAISAFAAAQSPITAGGSTTLTATFQNGTGSVDHGLGAVMSGSPISTGTLTDPSTTFTLTVTNAAGDSVTLPVSVATVAAPAISAFTAAQSTITIGGSTTLTATFQNGTGSLDHGLGAVTSGNPVATGTLTEPSTTFTLTVTNAVGETTTRQVTVATVAAPTISAFTAAQTPITAGGSTSLAATFQNGTGSVDHGLGAVASGGTVATGALTEPSTSFTLTVTNAAGDSVTRVVAVDTAAAPSIAAFTAAKSPLTTGNGTLLTATFEGGTGSVDQGLGAVLSNTPVETGALSASTTYTLTVTNAAGDHVSRTLAVDVVPAPTISRFTGSLSQIFAGQSSLLSADYTGGTGVVDAGVGALASGGSATVSPTATTTYTLTVTNAAGDQVTAGLTVSVNTAPTAISSFTASAPVVDFGITAQLDWTVTGAPSALTLNGVSVLGGPAYAVVVPVRRNFYTLSGSNPLGSDSRTVSVAARGVDFLAGSVGGPGNLDGPGLAARFQLPCSVAAGMDGTAYVADADNHVIRKIDANGNVTLLAGAYGQSGAVDGPAASARFYSPYGVAVDAAGNVYVADTNNSVIRKIAPDGTVSTLAGLARSMGSADGAGSAARFAGPAGVAVDAQGTVYVADTNNHSLRRITADGVVSTLAGAPGQVGTVDGTGSAARFCTPRNLALDAAGNLYVPDTDFNVIRKVSPAGIVVTWAGWGWDAVSGYGYVDGPSYDARFRRPYGVAVDGAGNVYVADTHNHLIRKITAGGTVSTLAGVYALGNRWVDGPGSSAGFSGPSSLAWTPQGTLLVTEFGNKDVRKVSPEGFTTTLAGLPQLTPATSGTSGTTNPLYFNPSPKGVAVDAAGNTYVADTNAHVIRKVTQAGVISTYAGTYGSSGMVDGPAASSKFSSPQGLALDAAGNLYVADMGNHAIRKITPAGAVSTFAGLGGSAGSTNGTGSAARFYGPSGVAMDAEGNLFVADTYNNTIRKVSSAGAVSTLAGSAGNYGSWDGTGANARFDGPRGIACDAAGTLFVTDYNNQTLRKISPAGAVLTLAGSPGAHGIADGMGAAARFSDPFGVAVDGTGNAYVADSANHLLRKVAPDGTVSTLAGTAGRAGVQFGVLPASLYLPFAVAMDPKGDLYLTASNGLVVITAP